MIRKVSLCFGQIFLASFFLSVRLKLLRALAIAASTVGAPLAGIAQVQVTPAQVVPFPGQANTVPFPGQTSTTPFPSSASQSSSGSAPSAGTATGSGATCDYACMSRRYQEQYMRDQCRASGNRQYYCKNLPLTPAQGAAIQDQSAVMRGQYGYYRNGTFYSNP